jgi:hypothetical protein
MAENAGNVTPSDNDHAITRAGANTDTKSKPIELMEL